MFRYFKVALSLETYGLTVEAQHMYLELIAKEQRGSGTGHVSQDELETWEVLFVASNVVAFIELSINASAYSIVTALTSVKKIEGCSWEGTEYILLRYSVTEPGCFGHARRSTRVPNLVVSVTLG